MSAFLDDITPFLGTGQNNEKNQSLAEYLEQYNADKYAKPSVTADVMVFSYDKENENIMESLKLLMIKRRDHPSIGYWALPGGFANMREDLVDTAKRELEEETGLKDVPIVQVYTYGEYQRDPRDRTVTISYLALVEEGSCKAVAGDDAAEAEWWKVEYSIQEEKEIMKNGFHMMKRDFEIRLVSEKLEKELKGIVAEYENLDSLLKEKEYEVINCFEIAFDHARFIMQGLAYLEERIS